jgi:DeoR/GlpR family transcriptional regulator of sugar metabolism
MIAAERARKILERLKAEGAVQVGVLAIGFGVAEETIRRDLARLESAGRLVRTHGGAISKDNEDLPYPLRQGAAQAAKAAIARRAAKEVQDGMTVMIDSSSTAYSVLAELGSRADLTIVTNSVPICADPAVTPHTILSTGGELRRRSMTFVGPMAVAALTRFRADVAIIGAKALSRNAGIMEASLADAEMKQAFIANARRALLVADTSKFDAEGTVAVGALGLVDALVTEVPLSEPWIRILAGQGVDVFLPDIARFS